MPRNILPISLFRHGWVTTLESENIPEDSYPSGTNLTGANDDGKLQGRFADSEVQATTPVYGANSYGWIIRNDSKRDLVFFQPSTLSLIAMQDFYGTTPGGNLIYTAPQNTEKASFNSLNRELHIGLGGAAPQYPQWVGYIAHGQFSTSPPNVLVAEKAACEQPSSLPLLSKVWYDGSANYYGYAEGVPYFFKIVVATGAITRTGLGVLDPLYGMAVESTGTYAYVIETQATGTTTIKITKIQLSDLTILGSYTGTLTGLQSGAMPTDLEWTNNGTNDFLYVACYHDSPNQANAWVFRAQLGSFGATTFTDVTPAVYAAANTSAGSWVVRRYNHTTGAYTNIGTDFDAEDAAHGTTLIQRLTRRSLTRISTGSAPGKVAWIWGPKNNQTWKETSRTYSYKWPVWLDSGSNPHNLYLVTSIMYTNDSAKESRYVIMGEAPAGNAVSVPATNGFAYDSVDLSFYFSLGRTLAEYDPGVALPTTHGAYVNCLSSTRTKETSLRVSPSMVDASDVHGPAIEGTANIYSYGLAALAETEKFGGSMFTVVAAAATGTTGFTAERSYHWAIAMEYDGVQVSPLSPAATRQDNTTGVQTGFDITFTIGDISALPKRVSAILLFRASGEETALIPDSQYRLVKRIELKTADWTLNDLAAATTIQDYVELTGETFDSYAGFSETMEHTMVHYGIACQANNHLFVGQCWHPDVELASHMIFRSLPYAYDTFDWSKDFLRLPFIPTAMVYFANRIWVFDRNKILRINPSGLYVEDTVEGIGCFDQRSVTVTEYGMFWADQNSLYMHNGQQIVPIGEAVRSSTSAASDYDGYLYILSSTYTESNKNYPSVAYDGVSGYVLFTLFGAPFSSEVYTTLAYHPVKQRWDKWTISPTDLACSANHCLIQGRVGETYLPATTKTIKIGGNTATTKASTVYTKTFDLGAPQQKKRFYYLMYRYTGTAPTITYSVDGGVFTALTANRIYAYGKRIQFYVTLAAGASISNVELIYRPLIGMR